MLKTSTFFAGAMLACTISYAQSARTAPAPTLASVKSLPAAANAKQVLCNDTLNTAILGEQPAIYGSTSVGYVAGTNSYGDEAKANIYPMTGTTTITASYFIFYAATAGAGSANTNVNFKVWDATGTGGTPGAAVATKSVPLSTLVSDVTNGDPTLVTFDAPVTVTGTFYLGVELPTGAGDTLAFYTNTDPGNSPYIGWERFDGGEWHAYNETASWGLNISNYIMPVASFNLVAGFTGPATLDLADSSTVSFTNTSTGGTNNAWTFQGGTPASSMLTNPGNITFNTPGTYTIELVHSNGTCTETFTHTLTVVDTGTGIAEDLANSVNVYPNPASSEIKVNLAGINAKNIQVVNAIGQVVKNQVVSTQEATVDVANLSNGIYFVQIETAEGTITKKVSVQK